MGPWLENHLSELSKTYMNNVLTTLQRRCQARPYLVHVLKWLKYFDTLVQRSYAMNKLLLCFQFRSSRGFLEIVLYRLFTEDTSKSNSLKSLRRDYNQNVLKKGLGYTLLKL